MFSFQDVSDNTSLSVVGIRSLKRRGIVLHETEGVNSLGWLQGDSASLGNPVSADFLATREGDILALTNDRQFAFHSGRARWRLYQEKDFTINQGFFGIEVENSTALRQVMTTQQYISVAALIRYLLTWNNISFRDICGHYECALPAGRKDDPRTLNWVMLTDELLSPSREASLLKFKGGRS